MSISYVLYLIASGSAVALGSAIPGNDSMRLSTHGFNNVMMLPGWLPIEPFYQDGYSYTGSYDPKAEFDIRHGLKTQVSRTLRAKPQNLRTRAGDELTKLDNDEFHVASKYRFQWIMEGGVSLTYGECADAVENIVTFLGSDHGEKYDKNDLSITISRNGNVKIIVTTKLLDAQPLDVEGHQALQYEGYSYPEAPLHKSDMESVIATTIQDLEGHVQRDPPPAHVPRRFKISRRKGNVEFTMVIHFGPEEEFPDFTYSDLLDIMQQFKAVCVQKNAWTVISGDLHLKATATQEKFDLLGYIGFQDIGMSFQAPQSELSTSGNSSIIEIAKY